MSVTPGKRAGWAKKFARLTAASKAAQEAELVGIHEAVQDGMTQADIAYMIGGVSPSCIAGRAAKGRAILEGRKRT